MRVWYNWEIDLIKEAMQTCSIRQVAIYLQVADSTLRTLIKLHNLVDLNNRQRKNRIRSSEYMDKLSASCKQKKGALEPAFGVKKGKKYERKTPSYNDMEQKCWHCKWATGAGDCEWANSGKPVPGWEAEPYFIRQKVKGELRFVDSFTIISCPKFESDAK